MHEKLHHEIGVEIHYHWSCVDLFPPQERELHMFLLD